MLLALTVNCLILAKVNQFSSCVCWPKSKLAEAHPDKIQACSMVMEVISTCSPCALVTAGQALFLALPKSFSGCDMYSQGTSVAICFWGTGSQHANPSLCNLWIWSLLSCVLCREHLEERKESINLWLLSTPFLWICLFVWLSLPSFLDFFPLCLETKFRLLTEVYKTADSLGHEFLRRLFLPQTLRLQLQSAECLECFRDLKPQW